MIPLCMVAPEPMLKMACRIISVITRCNQNSLITSPSLKSRVNDDKTSVFLFFVPSRSKTQGADPTTPHVAKAGDEVAAGKVTSSVKRPGNSIKHIEMPQSPALQLQTPIRQGLPEENP